MALRYRSSLLAVKVETLLRSNIRFCIIASVISVQSISPHKRDREGTLQAVNFEAPFIRTIASRKLIDEENRLKKCKYFTLVPDEDSENINKLGSYVLNKPSADELPEEHIIKMEEQEERRKFCEYMLNTLPPRRRIIFIYCYFEELSIKEIADMLHTSLNNVCSHLSQGRKKLNELYADEFHSL